MLSFNQMLMPIWDSETIYGESVLMVRDKNGEARAPLLFTPTGPVEVWNSGYTEKYEEGVDYRIEGSELVLTEGSRINSITEEKLYPEKEIPGESMRSINGNILWQEGAWFLWRQIAVTYPCKKGQWEGPKPCSVKDKLPLTYGKLREGKAFHLMVCGDSISQGFNTSKQFYTPPFQPNYGELVTEKLHRHFGSIIQYTNSSIAGTNTDFFIENIEPMVLEYAPDLIILAHGMNDGAKTPEAYRKGIEKFINIVRERKPETEFLLVATSMPNPLLTTEALGYPGVNTDRRLFKLELDKVAQKLPGVAVADITGVQEYMQKRKRYADISGNHVNHPNDFFHRVHAQFITQMFVCGAE